MINKCFHCEESHETIAQGQMCAKRYNYKKAPHLKGDTPPVLPPAPVMRKVTPSETRRADRRRSIVEEIRAAGAKVPEGSYAIRTHSGPNDITFVKVEKAGQAVFVKQYLSDELHKMPMPRVLDALVRIGADVHAALILFGAKTERCGVCHRRLTTRESRERGIGPKCAAGLGMAA